MTIGGGAAFLAMNQALRSTRAHGGGSGGGDDDETSLAIAFWVFVALVVLMFGGVCYSIWKHKEIEVSREHRTLAVVAINPPKHMYVTLRDEQDGTIYEVFVAKHCNRWRELAIGSRWEMTRATIRYPRKDNQEIWRIYGGSSLCPRG